MVGTVRCRSKVRRGGGGRYEVLVGVVAGGLDAVRMSPHAVLWGGSDWAR